MPGIASTLMTKVKLLQKKKTRLEVIKLEFILKLKIKCDDWLLADTCPQATNHYALFLEAMMFSMSSVILVGSGKHIFCDSQKLLTESTFASLGLDTVIFPVYVTEIEVIPNPCVNNTRRYPCKVSIYLVDILWVIYVRWTVKGYDKELACPRILDMCPN